MPHPFIEMLQARVTNLLKRGIDLGQIRRMALYTGFNSDEISTVTMADAPPGNKRDIRCSNSVEDGIIVKLNAAIEESAGLAQGAGRQFRAALVLIVRRNRFVCHRSYSSLPQPERA